MANSLSAKKRIRQNAKRRLRNRALKSSMKTQIKKFQEATQSVSDVNQVEKELRMAQKKIDQALAKGTMHKNTASRKKSQLARQMSHVRKKVG
ncbi:MAG: 30S ribosomal protein S20 [Planctomycetes bacterium]|nr:30S ribosomal protein S20 [Planctomycetota bacterium]